MKKLILVSIAFFGIFLGCAAQALDKFSVNMYAGESGMRFLSIKQKKAFAKDAAMANKEDLDFALIISKDGNEQITAWYNLSGKDAKLPASFTGTSTGINAISFDREQFDKCNTNQDLQRMAGHITNSSFSHYTTISNKATEPVLYPCFIYQQTNGKRGLIWVQAGKDNHFEIMVKAMQ